MGLTKRDTAGWQGLQRAGQVLAIALLVGVVGCGGGDDTQEDTGLSALDEGAGTDAGRSGAATGKAAAVVEVDPEEYTDFLAEEDDAAVKSRREFIEAKRVAVKYENGSRKREYVLHVFKDSPAAFHGTFQEWYENGRLWKQGSYEKGKKIGSWKFWSEDGKLLKEGDYVDGQPDGQWTYHRPDGTLSRVESFAAGKKDGEFTVYDEFGKHILQQQTFRDGLIHGAVVVYFPPTAGADAKPTKQREIQFVDGRQHGTAVEWFENGQKRVQLDFRNGKRHGPAIEWDQTGKVVSRREFRDGEPVDESVVDN